MDLYDLAERTNTEFSYLEQAIKNGGVSCEGAFNGFYVNGTATLSENGLNLIYLHANLFGTLPIVSLPSLNVLCLWYEMIQLNGEKGLAALVGQAIKESGSVSNPGLSHEELFSVVQFLSCIWADIRIFSYQYRAQIYWTPLVSFESPVYYRSGGTISWNPSHNVLKAEILEIINSVYRLLLDSYGYYKHCFQYSKDKPKPPRRHTPKTDFLLVNSDTEDIYDYPGVACLRTDKARTTACEIFTRVNGIITRLACMLLHLPIDAIPFRYTKWNTLAQDLKQFYMTIQKMELYLNN